MHDHAVTVSTTQAKRRIEPLIDEVYVAAINAMSAPDA